MNTTTIQNNFSSGEISPILFGRSDLESYYKALAHSENFIVTKEGSVRKRHGLSQIAKMPYAAASATVHAWTAVSYSDSHYSLCSSDGTLISFYYDGRCVGMAAFAGVNWKSIARYQSLVMAVGIESSNAVCAFSCDNGATWKKNTIGSAYDIGAILYCGGKFVCEKKTKSSGYVSCISSTTGDSWDTLSTLGNKVTTIASNVCYLNNVHGLTPGYGLFSGTQYEVFIYENNTPQCSYDTVSITSTGKCSLSRGSGSYYCLAVNQKSVLIARYITSSASGWTTLTTFENSVSHIFSLDSNKVIAFGQNFFAIGTLTGDTVTDPNDWSWTTGTFVAFTSIVKTDFGLAAINGSTIYNVTCDDTTVSWSEFLAIDQSFAIVPYAFDRTKGGFVYITNTKAYFFDKSGSLHDWTGSSKDDDNLPYCPIPSSFLGASTLQFKQIGDQLWLTDGSQMLIATITDNASLSISSWSPASKPSTISCSQGQPSSSTKTTNVYFKVTSTSSVEKYKTLQYGCYGVKDSVISRKSTYDATVSVTWEVGNKVEIFVTVAAADVDKYDSIIVGKNMGSNIGILAQFYLTDEPTTAYSSTGSVCYRHDDGKYYTAAEGGSVVTLKSLYFKFTDENHTPSDLVYDQTNTLGIGFDHPLCVDCFQQRRVFANASTDNADYPMTLWFSEVGNLDNFWANRPVDAADPFSPTISSTGPASINYLKVWGETLVAFTDAGIFSIGFSQTSNGFSSSTCRIAKFSDTIACDSIPPLITDAGIFFVGADRKTVHSISIGQNGSLTVINRSLLVEHMTRTASIVAMAYQQFPDGIIWLVKDDGDLLSVTINANEGVTAWSRSSVPGCRFVNAITIGSCSDSATDRTYSDVVFCFIRESYLYFCSLNSTYADVIDNVSTNVSATMTTIRPESRQSTIVGYGKNIKDLIFRLYDSGVLKVRPATSQGTVQALAQVPTSNSANFTGDAKVMPRGYVNDDGQLTVVSDDGNACEILSIVSELEV